MKVEIIFVCSAVSELSNYDKCNVFFCVLFDSCVISIGDVITTDHCLIPA